MKKVLLTAAFMVCAMVASAQVYVGGGLGFTKIDDNGAKATQWEISPEVGYVLNENLSLGVALSYADYDNDKTAYSINPYARYTFLRAGNFSVFAQGELIFGQEEEGGVKEKELGIAVVPGVAYAINEKFSVVAKLGEGLSYKKIEDNKSFGLNLDNGLSFGLYYSF